MEIPETNLCKYFIIKWILEILNFNDYFEFTKKILVPHFKMWHTLKCGTLEILLI